MLLRRKLVLFLLFWILPLALAPRIFADEFDPGKNDFLLELNGVTAPYDVRMVSVLPGETLTLFASQDESPVSVDVNSDSGELNRTDTQGEWQWEAPEDPGLYTIYVKNSDTKESVVVNAFVTYPYSALDRQGRLNGYLIGHYPSAVASQYAPPTGFVEVTEDNKETFISPHFQLKQFECKESSEYPKYVVLSQQLLIKLEMILEKLNDLGFPLDTMRIMSGFRTPAHNRHLGTVSRSRHMYGDAADIQVAADLNGDGRINFKDSLVLREIVEQMEVDYPDSLSRGGIGVYKHIGLHGPFVHVDTRGTAVTWVNNPRRHRRYRHRPRHHHPRTRRVAAET